MSKVKTFHHIAILILGLSSLLWVVSCTDNTIIDSFSDVTEPSPPFPTDTSTPFPTNTLLPLPTDTLTPFPTDTLPPPPTDTSTPFPTNTLPPPPTDTPTPFPTDTPTPQPTGISGWKRFSTVNIVIWLPDTYEGGDLSVDIEIMINRLASLGDEYQDMADMIATFPELFDLLAFDTESQGGILTNVVVAREETLTVVDLDTYVEWSMELLLPDQKMLDQKPIPFEPYEAQQLILESEWLGIESKSLIYIVKDKNVFWTINFTTGKDEFEERLTTFEQSIRTFSIQP